MMYTPVCARTFIVHNGFRADLLYLRGAPVQMPLPEGTSEGGETRTSTGG